MLLPQAQKELVKALVTGQGFVSTVLIRPVVKATCPIIPTGRRYGTAKWQLGPSPLNYCQGMEGLEHQVALQNTEL